jgi:hypothetical protein
MGAKGARYLVAEAGRVRSSARKAVVPGLPLRPDLPGGGVFEEGNRTE